MLKTVRNTFFTLAAVVLTAFGLKWNTPLIRQHTPIAVGETVLAAQRVGAGATDFPLDLTFSTPKLRLGQSQRLTIQTVPEAALEIITQHPDGSISNEQTTSVRADSNGTYRMSYVIDDFHELGVFRVSVMAHSGDKTAETIGSFTVNSWQDAGQTIKYVYPLVP